MLLLAVQIFHFKFDDFFVESWQFWWLKTHIAFACTTGSTWLPLLNQHHQTPHKCEYVTIWYRKCDVHVNFEIICDRWFYHHRSINFCENDFQYVQAFGADALQWNVCCFWSYETYRTIIGATAENQQKKVLKRSVCWGQMRKRGKKLITSIEFVFSFSDSIESKLLQLWMFICSLHEFQNHIQCRYKRALRFDYQWVLLPFSCHLHIEIASNELRCLRHHSLHQCIKPAYPST